MTSSPTIHLVNPSRNSFGVAVITPRWLFVLAAATGTEWGDPRLTDECLTRFDMSTVKAGDVVGIGIHTGNVRRGYEIGQEARAKGAYVVYGGIHATLFPEEVLERGAAHAVVKGDGDLVWRGVVADCLAGRQQPIYDGGRISGDSFVPARWDLMPPDSYMLASVQTVRGCPKHCSFCSVWRTDGQQPRNREVEKVVGELVDLRRRGFRFVALADDNFYPVPLSDLAQAARREDKARLRELEALRAERFALMKAMEQLPRDMVFFTQITMEAGEDPEFLDAMHKARIKGALVGIESVSPEGLKDVHKGFNVAGDALIERLRGFREHGVHVLKSFIFELANDRERTFDATVAVAQQAGVTFAQFVMLTPFPGTNDFAVWEASMAEDQTRIAGVPLTRHWLIPQAQRPKVYTPHPTMAADDIRRGTQRAWDQFYSLTNVWVRSRCVQSLKSRVAFVLISKLYRQMYANTGIATDSARVGRSARWARWLAHPCRRLFTARPMPDLSVPA